MNPGHMFDRVYGALKQRVLSAQFAPGERIDPAVLTGELASSITPIRDALHRLAGEQLVVALPSFGFRMPLLTEPALGDLYGWMDALLQLAIGTPDTARSVIALPLPPTDDMAGATAQLFQQIIMTASNREVAHAGQNANDRLHAVRIAEAVIFEDLPGELGALEWSWVGDDRATLTTLIGQYHRRRQKSTGRIIDHLNRHTH